MSKKLDLCVLMPAYNEGSRPINFAKEIINTFKATDEKISLTIIIIDDGSQLSPTPEPSQQEKSDFNLKKIRTNQNLGKDHALFFGLANAPEALYYCAIDSDGEQPADLLIQQWKLTKNKKIDIILAQRKKPNQKESIFKKFLRKSISTLSKKILSLQLNGLTDCVMLSNDVSKRVISNWKEQNISKYIPWRILFATFFKSNHIVNFSAVSIPKEGGSRFSSWRLIRLGLRCLLLNPRTLTTIVYTGLTLSAIGSILPIIFVLSDWFAGILYPGYLTVVALLTMILWSSLALLSLSLSRLIIEVRSIQYNLGG